MSLWHDKFGVLGLQSSAVQAAIKTAGTFVLCASELQQVIDGSIKVGFLVLVHLGLYICLQTRACRAGEKGIEKFYSLRFFNTEIY